jgi:hypothetical protein
LQTPLHQVAALNLKKCAEVMLRHGADKTLNDVRNQEILSDEKGFLLFKLL